MRESEFQAMVIKLARLHGFRVAHFRTVRVQRQNGSVHYQTPVQADGAGWPDCVFVKPPAANRPGKLLVAELKIKGKRPTAQQEAWLLAFRVAGVPAYLWTWPDSWDEIVEVLSQ